MITKSRNLAEPGDLEVLYFYPQYSDGGIGIAPAPDSPTGTVSMVGTGRNGAFFHLIFTPQEADMLSVAFQQAKNSTPTP